ncbi:mechanosensitive channel MscS [compost metagenome]
MKWDLLESFKRALDKNNINIAYPQMDVHLYQVANAAASQQEEQRAIEQKGTAE